MRTAEEILAEMSSILDNAAGRALTDEEAARYEACEAELVAVQRHEAITARHRAYNTVVTAPGEPSPRTRPEETIETAFRAYLTTAQPNMDISDLAVAGPGDIGNPRPRNAQSTLAGPAGGYLVPEGFRAKIVERLVSFGGLANVCETITTETGNTLPWPVVDDSANEGEIVDENDQNSTGADVTFTTEDLGAHTFQAGGTGGEPLLLPWELMQDSAFDIERFLSRILGQRLARALAPYLITGTGIKQPKGILHGVTGLEMSSGGPTYGDLVDLKTAIDNQYWPNARWAFNQATLGRVWKITDSHGDPIWRPSAQSGALEDGTLLGHPITIDNSFPDVVTSNGADDNWGVFGDLSAGYILRRVKDVAIVVNPWSSAKKRQNEYTAWMRADARPQDTYAYKVAAGYTA